MKKTFKKLLIIFLSMTIVINFYNLSFASYIIDTTQKKLEGPGEKMILSIGVAGDSYGGFLIDNLTKIYELDLANYCLAGSTIEKNKDRIVECIYDKYKYIVISIGVNDHLNQTPIKTFFDTINLFAELGKKLNKYIIFHTYMAYPSEAFNTVQFTCNDYDNILRVIASINSHVKYIDMHDTNGEMYYQKDNIHYNENYYTVLINRLLNTLDEIKNER